MTATIVAGLRERALEEAARAEDRRAKAAEDASASDLARTSRHTEDLIRQHFGIEVTTDSGVVTIDGLRLGARWTAVAGRWYWYLCLLEPCALDCVADVATPLLDGWASLGDVLRTRERGYRAIHRELGQCKRRVAS